MIKEKFNVEKENKTFRRVNERHPLDIFIGYNEKNNPTMIISVEGKERVIQSSQAIQVNLYKVNSREIRIAFSLLDKDKETIFYKFCEDMIDSTISISNQKAFEFVIARWNKWRFMFKKPSEDLLTENQVIGLMGELLFLNNYMFNKYGVEKSLISWQGPSKNHKDFEIENTWYEVKAVKQAALTVKISSVEQLDSNLEGYLEVIFLDKTNKEYINAISLNKLVEQIGYKISSFEAYKIFTHKLAEVGYFYDEEYDKYIYKFIRRNTYLVNNEFPKVKADDLKEGIVKVSYDILLKDINRFMRGKD